MDRENVQNINQNTEKATQQASRVRNVQPRTAEGATQRPAQSAQGQVRRTAPAPAQKTQQGTQTAQRTQQRQQAPARTQATQRPQTGTRTQAARPQTTTRSQAGTSQAQRTARPVRQADPAARTTQTRTARPAEPSKVQGKTPTTAAPKKTTPQTAAPRQTDARQRTESIRQRQSVRAASTSGGGRGGNTTATRSRSGNPNKKKKSKFGKFLAIYCAALAVIVIVGLLVFNSFMKKVEDNQPSNKVAGIVKELSGGKAKSFLTSNSDMIKCLENVDNIIEQSAANMEGKQLSFIENSEYRAEAPSYNITADGQIVAKVTLGKDKKGAFGLQSWKLTALDVASYVPNTLSYQIMAPEGASVFVNGTELGDAYKVSDAGVPENLKTAAKYVSIPNFVTYKVSGFTNAPTVTAKGSDGSELGISQTSNAVVCGTTTTQDFINSVDRLVNNGIDAWGRHFINMGGNLRAYILEGCDYYGYIFGSDTMDPIYTAFYEFESIADYSFTEKSASNYIRYSNDCFTVDVKYQMQVDFTTDRMSDTNQKLDATWVLITQNGGEDWYIVDCIYKS